MQRGRVGTAAQIAVPLEMITELHGIMFDLDLKLLRSALVDVPKPTPLDLYERLVARWLERILF